MTFQKGKRLEKYILEFLKCIFIEIYKFIQISNDVVKGKEKEPILSADKAVPTLIEETSEGKRIFESSEVEDEGR